MKLKHLFLFVTALVICFSSEAKDYTVTSPDGKVTLVVKIDKQILWSVRMDGLPVLDLSPVGLELDNEVLGVNPKIRKSKAQEINETTKAVVPYKFRDVVDYCNELLLTFKGDYALRFRAYNNGVVYRIEVKRDGLLTVKNEESQLNFSGDCKVLFPEEESFFSHYERLYTDTVLSAIGKEQFCSLPALITNRNNIKMGITETGQSDYPGMFLKGTGENSLKAIFPPYPVNIKWVQDRYLEEKIIENAPYIAKISGTKTLPWRCLLLARADKELIENNLPYVLAEKNVIEDVSWIKPGKVAWEWWSACNVYGVDFKSGINTNTYKYYIDFASEYGLEYILMDGHWSDYIKIDQPSPGVDVEEIINYGKRKNVGVILWVYWGPFLKDLEKYSKIYSDWGAAGVKVDFMQRADQTMVNYYEKIAAVTAKYKMLVDFHGAFKPNGLQRKYPNVVNFEGVLGGEHNKWSKDADPKHHVTLPFTRMLAGPLDYTPGAMVNETLKGFRVDSERPMSLGTRCHQAGMYVVYEAPLQMLCGNASNYMREPEFTRFIAQMPTTWDQTVAVEGEKGEYLVVARKNEGKWYIGGLTNWTARDLEVDLGFLGRGKWEIEYVTDGINADRYASDYILKNEKMTGGKKLKISMAPGGGYAAILTKID